MAVLTVWASEAITQHRLRNARSIDDRDCDLIAALAAILERTNVALSAVPVSATARCTLPLARTRLRLANVSISSNRSAS